MAKKTVTKKRTRSTSGRTSTLAKTRSKKTRTTRKTAKTAKKPAKTTRKPAAKVAKKPAKKTATKTKIAIETKKTDKTATRSAATTSRTTKKTATTASAGSRKISSKTATKPRSRSAAKRPAPDANGYVIINGRRVRMMAAPTGPVAVVPKRTRTRPQPPSEPEPTGKPIKTKLGRKELNHFRTQLLTQRAELVGDLSAMETQALRSGSGNPSHMPIHMADVGTDTFDQDFMLGLAEAERRRLREIDAALKRIEDRTYGMCERTSKVIPKARLDAKPWARYTIESAREIERGLGE